MLRTKRPKDLILAPRGYPIPFETPDFEIRFLIELSSFH